MTPRIDDSVRIDTPWTDDQVASLNAYQKCGHHHPFTYGEGAAKVDLIATAAGWVAHHGGPVVQTWAHEFMCNWAWRQSSLAPYFKTDG